MTSYDKNHSDENSTVLQYVFLLFRVTEKIDLTFFVNFGYTGVKRTENMAYIKGDY
jgi:hypothetical protein